MCLQTKWKKPKKAEKNIICYKLFDNDEFCSQVQNFKYEVGKKYKTELIITKDICAYDQQAANSRDELLIDELLSISKGFHTARYPKRFDTTKWDSHSGIIVKCIIPKGSLYYSGLTNLLVSNQLIVTGEIVRKADDEYYF